MAESESTARRAELWLGTMVEITAAAPRSACDRIQDAIAAAFIAIAQVHRALSLHDPASELSRLNGSASRSMQTVSADLRAVLRCALEIAARSAGAFDPTVGGKVAALGFLPPQAQSDGAADWRDVQLTAGGVCYARPLVLDFGGIAKGYAVDCAIEALRAGGMTRGCVNAGGDLRVFGGGREVVHVRTSGAHSALLPLVEIGDGAVATSAWNGQRKRFAGRWATSLIDPATRMPMMTTRTISVVAPTCMVADALTKVVALRGVAAARLLESYAATAVLLSPAAGRWRWTEVPAAPMASRSQRSQRAPLEGLSALPRPLTA